ncbi:hypothetical protein N9924_00780 [bacterium]|nr:hypothetical protein [bacterium]
MIDYNGFNITTDGTFGYHVIKPIGKGSIPKSLRGSFTNTTFAKKSIDAYLVSNKAVTNGKNSKTG